jgi:hypothetical protein
MGKPFDAAGIIHVWRADADSSHWERVAAVQEGYAGTVAAFELVTHLLGRATPNAHGRTIAAVTLYHPNGAKRGAYIVSQAVGEQAISEWCPVGTRSTWMPESPIEEVGHPSAVGGDPLFRLARADRDAGAVPRTYQAEGGETPQTIAKRFDALSRPRWAAELKAANPNRDWTSRIYAADVITIPDAWPSPFWGSARDRGYLDASGPPSEGGAAADRLLRRVEDSW